VERIWSSRGFGRATRGEKNPREGGKRKSVVSFDQDRVAIFISRSTAHGRGRGQKKRKRKKTRPRKKNGRRGRDVLRLGLQGKKGARLYRLKGNVLFAWGKNGRAENTLKKPKREGKRKQLDNLGKRKMGFQEVPPRLD